MALSLVWASFSFTGKNILGRRCFPLILIQNTNLNKLVLSEKKFNYHLSVESIEIIMGIQIHLWDTDFNFFKFIIISEIVGTYDSSIFIFLFFYFLFFVSLGLYLQHMELSRLGLNQSCSCQPTPQPSKPCLQPKPQLEAMPDH